MGAYGAPAPSARFVANLLSDPGPDDDKYSRGVTLMATGSSTYPGAAVLGVAGALSAGPGMVRYRGPSNCDALVVSQFPEVVLNAGQFQCAVVGSGWDRVQVDIAEDIADLAADACVPMVVDAAAVHYASRWEQKNPNLVLTPHLREAQRLWEDVKSASETAPAESLSGPDLAVALAQATGAVVALKTGITWIASQEGLVYEYLAPSAWGATAGSGDVLAGILGGTIAAGHRKLANSECSLIDLVAAGVWLHGTAAAFASGVLTSPSTEPPVVRAGHPIRASQIASLVPEVIDQLLNNRKRDTWIS